MSEIRAATVSNLAGTGPVTLTGQYAAKAWVNFNGTGTVAIRASGNVSSITDNGVGQYTVNFNNALTDANYSAVANAGTVANDGATVNPDAYTSSSFSVVFRKATNIFDYTFCNVTIVR
jgi:hypothetical protein